MYKDCFLLIVFLLLAIGCNGQGILFSSNDTLISDRTSYDVFAYRQPTLEESFQLEFELTIQQKETFGYIFTINDIKGEDALSLIYLNNDSFPEFRFNLKGKQNLMTIRLNEDEIGSKRKIKCYILVDLINNKIVFKANKHQTETTYITDKLKCKPKIVFGKTEHSIDVPAFRLLDLEIRSGKKVISFPLNESEGNVVYDVKGRKFGHISKPTWLINDSFHWKLKKILHFDDESSINFSRHQQKLIIAQIDSIVFFDVVTEELYKSKTVNSLLVPMRLGMSVVSEEQNRLFVYELNDVSDNYNLASLQVDSLYWTHFSTKLFEQQRHHHNSWFDDENNRLYIFGGFGNKMFTNKVNYFDFRTNSWHEQKFKGDTIFPRFFSGIVEYSKNEILLFGGVGNKSGDQSLGKEYYQDCYLVDLSLNMVKKLWEIHDEKEFVSSRNMILSEDSSSFYTINYEEYKTNTYLRLNKYDLEDGSILEYGDSIPMISERIRTNANLYLNKGTDELLCVTQEFELDGSNTIKIYSIDFPPVTASQLITNRNEKRGAYLYLFIFILVLFLLIGLYYCSVIRKRKRKIYQKELSDQNLTDVQNTNQGQKTNSISLFGNFCVFDRNGRDISYLFSPKLQQLLIILILNYPNEDGVSSEEIYDALWPDKESAKAKNLKNVTISQLRKILIELEGVKIGYDRPFFKLEKSDATNIDYLNFLYYLVHFKENPEESLCVMYGFIKKGAFLKGINLEWLDKDKQLLENSLVRTMEDALVDYYKLNLSRYVIIVGNILFAVDPINEASLFFMLGTYKKLRMIVEAKKVYNAFLVEYLKTYNEGYKRTFYEIINQSPQKLLSDSN